MTKVRFVGLDVHADTIAVAVAETDGEVRSHSVIPNRLESIRKLIHKLGPVQRLRACYEAGPTGYVLCWQLTQLGVACEVIAPSLVPTKAGDRVKTDRRDAEKLARCHRAGELTAVWVPTGPRGFTGSGAGPRGGEKRPVEGTAPAGQLPATPRPSAGRNEGLDQTTSGVDQESCSLRPAGTGSHTGRLPGGSGSRGGTGL